MTEKHTSRLYQVIAAIAHFIWHHIFRMRVFGAENISTEGPAIVICNHKSNWDPFAVGCSTRRQLYFLSKVEVTRAPILGALARRLDAIAVERGGTDIEAMRACLNRIKQGRMLAIFPEGTRFREPGLGKFENGVAMIALRSGAPVIPGYVRGIPFKRLSIRFGAPIYLADLERVNSDTIETATTRMVEAVTALQNIADK